MPVNWTGLQLRISIFEIRDSVVATGEEHIIWNDKQTDSLTLFFEQKFHHFSTDLREIPHGPAPRWSCGVLMFEMLEGRPPFRDPNESRCCMENLMKLWEKRWNLLIQTITFQVSISKCHCFRWTKIGKSFGRLFQLIMDGRFRFEFVLASVSFQRQVEHRIALFLDVESAKKNWGALWRSFKPHSSIADSWSLWAIEICSRSQGANEINFCKKLEM